MRIFQALPSLAYGDAVGNDALAIRKIIEKMGYQTDIFAENHSPKLASLCKDAKTMKDIRKNDVLIYHYSIGSDLNETASGLPCRKIMVYHNITPPDFFAGYNAAMYNLAKRGREQLQKVLPAYDYCVADSEYNKEELARLGCQKKIDVVPIMIPFEDYDNTPDKKTIKRYEDDWINLLFVGRVAPNKKQEDLIKAFYYYKKHINEKSRLFIVGSYQGMETYYKRLSDYVSMLDLKDVVFTGHISFPEILAYYQLADVFLCMSEHEGFCVPLLEAMYFDIPVLAYGSCAVPYTMGGSGLVFDDKDPRLVARLLHKALSDEALRLEILTGQRKRLEDFSHEKAAALFEQCLREFICQ